MSEKEDYTLSLATDDEVVDLEEYQSHLSSDDGEVVNLSSDYTSSLTDDDGVLEIDENELVSLVDGNDEEIVELASDTGKDESVLGMDFSEDTFDSGDTETANEVELIQPIEPKELTKEEAQELTEHIRSTADVLYVLVARAHAGKAHKALGYSNFGEYVKAEFNISRSRAYQLINQAEVITAIEQAAPDGTEIRLSELAARDLKNYVDVLVPAIKEHTDGVDSSEAGAIVEELVNDYRDLSQKEKEEKEFQDLSVGISGDDLEFTDFDDMPEFNMPEFDGEGGSGGSPFDNMNDFDNLDDLSDPTTGNDFSGIEIGDPNEVREKIENVYAFYSALTALNNMGNIQDIIDSIQDARKEHINSSLPKAKAWLDDFAEAWFGSQEDEKKDIESEFEGSETPTQEEENENDLNSNEE